MSSHTFSKWKCFFLFFIQDIEQNENQIHNLAFFIVWYCALVRSCQTAWTNGWPSLMLASWKLVIRIIAYINELTGESGLWESLKLPNRAPLCCGQQGRGKSCVGVNSGAEVLVGFCTVANEIQLCEVMSSVVLVQLHWWNWRLNWTLKVWSSFRLQEMCKRKLLHFITLNLRNVSSHSCICCFQRFRMRMYSSSRHQSYSWGLKQEIEHFCAGLCLQHLTSDHMHHNTLFFPPSPPTLCSRVVLCGGQWRQRQPVCGISASASLRQHQPLLTLLLQRNTPSCEHLEEMAFQPGP